MTGPSVRIHSYPSPHASPNNPPHKSPYMGKTSPHIHLYIVVKEKNEGNDVGIHP